MAGSCDAFVRRTGNTAVLYIPYKFWGLEIGEKYRVILTFSKHSPTQIPYSFDVRLCKVGASARVTIPKCISDVDFGDKVHIWVGRPDDFNNSAGWAVGRGVSKEERTKYLEEQTDILRRCAGQQVHN